MTDLPLRFTCDDDRLQPRRATPGAAGFDLSAAEDAVLPVNGRRHIPTGIRVQIPEGHVGILASRSGWGLKYGITLANSIGIIDADYRGELGVVLINHGNQPIAINRYDRIAQLVITPIATPDLQRVNNLDTTQRGHGGFGSTNE